MSKLSLLNAKSHTVTGSSAKFADALKPGVLYRICGDVDFWYELDTEGAAVVAAEDGAVFVPAGVIAIDTPRDGAYLHVIKPTGGVDGTVNIAEVLET